jgi:DNA modification methylase
MNTLPMVDVVALASIQYGDRIREDFGELEELKASILRRGIIQTLAVKRLDDGSYLLLAGGRRWKACTELGVERVPVRIYDRDLNDEEIKAIELEENLYRKDLSWQEEVALKAQIHELQLNIHGGAKVSTAPDAPGWSKRDTAELLGESATNTAADLNLSTFLEAIPELKNCDTKAEATKLLKKLTNQVKVDTLAKQASEMHCNTPIEILRQQIMSNYLIRDCVEGMKEVEDEVIDLVEIDPPYAIKLKENKFALNRGDKQHDNLQADDYNEIDGDKYLPFMEQVFKESYRCLKKDGWLLCWFGPDPWFEPLLHLLRKTGFVVKGMPALWVKNVGQTMMPSRYLGNSYEMFFYARKGSASIQKQGRLNTFNYPTTSGNNRIHLTERPVELIEDVLDTFALPGSRVMVPFLGSGNTILAAYNKGMQAFGFDLTDNYRNHFVARVMNFTPKTILPVEPID